MLEIALVSMTRREDRVKRALDEVSDAPVPAPTGRAGADPARPGHEAGDAGGEGAPGSDSRA